MRRCLWVLVPAVIWVNLLDSSNAAAAIVNTLRGFDGDQAGWSGEIAGSYGASGGNTQETKFQGVLQIQWHQKKETFRLVGLGKRSTTVGIETARSLMGHLRHNHRFSRRWSSLLFLQAQENPFQQLKSRTLMGAGGRFDLFREKGFHLALGAATMLDREQLEGEANHTTEQRLSVFVSSVFEIRKGIDLDGLVFYQPAWSDFSDWRFFGNLDLDIDLVGSLTLFTGVQVEHDSQPPLLVEKTDWETTTGFKVGF